MFLEIIGAVVLGAAAAIGGAAAKTTKRGKEIDKHLDNAWKKNGPKITRK